MIEYLEKLVEEEQWEKALAFAEQLMVSGEYTVRDLMVTNCALLTSRLYLKEFYGALLSGQLGRRLAMDQEEWDYYGRACLDLGVVHARLRQPEEEISAYFDFLAKLPVYRKAIRYEAVVWFNLGIAYRNLGKTPEASRALARALQVANRHGQDRDAHGVRQALIETYLDMGELVHIPEILAKCLHFIRHNPNAHEISESRHWHFKLRARFAVKTNRLERATAVAGRGLQEAYGNPRHQFDFHMILAEIQRNTGRVKESLHQSLSARVCAMRCRRYDLECEAADFIYELTRAYPTTLQEVQFEVQLPGEDSTAQPADSR